MEFSIETLSNLVLLFGILILLHIIGTFMMYYQLRNRRGPPGPPGPPGRRGPASASG